MNEGWYRTVFECSTDAILIIKNKHFVACNDSALRMLGYTSRQEILNTHPARLSPASQPDGRLSEEKADELMDAAFRKGSLRFEWIHLRANGEPFPVEVTLTAVPNSKSNPIFLVVWRDISEQKAVEEELRRLTSIVESTSDLVSTATPEGKLLFLNDAGRRMLGIDEYQDVTSLKIQDAHPPASLRLVFEIGIPAAIEKGVWVGETIILNRGQHEIPVSQVIIAHKTHRGDVEYLSTIMRDISGPKKAERFLNSILNTVADPIYVKDESHRYITVNDSLCEFIGLPRKTLLQKSDDELFGPATASELRKQDEAVFLSGREEISEEQITDGKGMIRHISIKNSAFTDETGKRFLVGIVRDITGLKSAEKKLHDNIQLLDSIIKYMPACVKLVTREGTLLDMNPAGLAMIGARSKESVLGKNICGLVCEEDREAYMKFNESVCGGRKETLRFCMMTLDGARLVLETLAVPIPYGADGNMVQLGITRDITEQIAFQEEKKKLEKRLYQSQKMEAIGTLAGGIAHDFNNILGAIIGYTELAKLEASAESPVIKNLQQVLKACDRAKDLAKQILTFSRQTEREHRPTQLQRVAKEVLKLLRASIPTTIHIMECIDRTSGTVLADATQLHQVIMNLCTNAYHAMRETGGVLTVEVNSIDIGAADEKVVSLDLAPGPHVMLRISDTGHGMSPAVLGRIFEPYYTTKSKDEGTGMGLAVVHGIVKSHNGYIAAYSELGKGSTFEVFLPKIAATESKPDKEVIDIPRGTERILLIDDEKALVYSLQQMLERLGYQVAAVTGCEAAERLFSDAPGDFDLVITDMTMPVITGAELSRRFLALRRDIPIILCTGFSDLINAEKAKAIGIREFVMKPVVFEEIAGVVRKVLDEAADAKSGRHCSPD